jgi:hypothetical protein
MKSAKKWAGVPRRLKWATVDKAKRKKPGAGVEVFG